MARVPPQDNTAPRFRLHLNMDNDAFTGDPRNEIARLLRETANRILAGSPDAIHWWQTIRDINGNDVGSFAIKAERYRI